MFGDGMFFVSLVLAAFGIFALVLGYQSLAEWRWLRNGRK